jgi:hypothetical protein
MNHRVEPITEIDFQAYVDDELPTGRRIEVEAHMCRHAADAARVMADLRTRDELRLALTDIPLTPRGATIDAALRLELGLSRDPILALLVPKCQGRCWMQLPRHRRVPCIRGRRNGAPNSIDDMLRQRLR